MLSDEALTKTKMKNIRIRNRVLIFKIALLSQSKQLYIVLKGLTCAKLWMGNAIIWDIVVKVYRANGRHDIQHII